MSEVPLNYSQVNMLLAWYKFVIFGTEERAKRAFSIRWRILQRIDWDRERSRARRI